RKMSRDENFKKVRSIITGGERRQDSVRAGLENLNPDARFVAVHDAARPLVSPEQIEGVFEQCRVAGAAALAEPISDTLKRADVRSEEHTSELQSLRHLVCRLLL